MRTHIPSADVPVFEREYKDIDLVTLKGESRVVSKFLVSMGYVADRAFNATNGHRRLLFYDVPNQRQVDVFVGSFEMCHDIPITERITLATHGIPLAELLLTKMQVVELNLKDRMDNVTMLYHHEVADDDVERINAGQVARLCAADWGLWRTTKMNVERVRESLASSGLSVGQQELVAGRLTRLWQRIEAEPKSSGGSFEIASATRCAGMRSPREVG